jgi:hypothetical protein
MPGVGYFTPAAVYGFASDDTSTPYTYPLPVVWNPIVTPSLDTTQTTDGVPMNIKLGADGIFTTNRGATVLI